jgi:malonyl-CoA O-methyltransferase
LRRVRTLFNTPARITRIAGSDFLRREVSARMHDRLALVKIEPRRVLDAGCGAGGDLMPLQERYPQAQIVGLDGAQAMLMEASGVQSAADSALRRLLRRLMPPGFQAGAAPGASLLCADFARVPLSNGSVDLLWSNLALHWHSHPDRVIAEWQRVLAVDGLLMFSCFGPDTFKEVRNAFNTLDHAPHALSFVDMHDYGDMLIGAGFSTPVMDMETITLTYDSTDKLLTDVRAWGGNPVTSQRRGLVGRAGWSKVLKALGRARGPDGRLRLSLEVVYGHAFRPAPRTTASGETIVRFDLPKK